MAKYQKYAECKDSGVEWLGVIPRHWDMSKLRYLFDFSKGLSITKENLQDDGIPCVNYGEVHSKYGFEINPKKHQLKCVSENYLKSSENALLNKGDFVFADTSEDLKGSGNFTHLVSSEHIFAGYHTVIARPYDAFTSRFYAYLFDSKEFRSQIQLAVKGVKVFSITQAMLRAADAWLPSTDEQIQIANFLDYETTKIDTLIAKQEKLIELLKEKRQAVISNAVTKGLNPNVAMKDSGVEWLGDVPEHWIVMQFRRITSLSQGLQIPQSERLHEPNDNTVEYITIKSLNAKGDAYKEYIYNASDRVLCEKSDVLLARTGATGEVVTNVRGAFHNNFFKISYSNKILRDFLVYILKVKELKSHLLMLAGTTTIPDLNHGAFLGTQIALPSLEEQNEIIEFIDDYLRRSLILEDKARVAIQLMQERRTALISAAVTGKIDVRDWQNPHNNNNRDNMELSA